MNLLCKIRNKVGYNASEVVEVIVPEYVVPEYNVTFSVTEEMGQ